jgi:uncharacterized protein YndB with AHSA1/START domain
MIEHQLETTLDQSPEEAFDFFVDFRNEPAWNPDCLMVEQTSRGPIAAGTTFSGRMRRVGRIETEIVELERPRRCATVERSHLAEGTFDYRFTPRDGGTSVSVVMRIQPRGPMRLLEPFIARMMKSIASELPERMRRGIDAAKVVREHVANA